MMLCYEMLYHVMWDVMFYYIILSSIVSLSLSPPSHLSVSPSSMHLYQGELLVILLGTAEEGDQ